MLHVRTPCWQASLLLLSSVVLLAPLGPACSPNELDDSLNALPQLEQGEDAGRDSGPEHRDQGPGPEDLGPRGDVHDGGLPQIALPATYRFECIDVMRLGSAGEEDFQTRLLETQWNLDIPDFKLNILFDFIEADAAAGTAKFQVRSGVGSAGDALCGEAQSDSPVFDAQLTTRRQEHRVHPDFRPDRGQCVDTETAATESGAYGSILADLTRDDLLYIYAEDDPLEGQDEGIAFNCTADDQVPDAVPLRGARASVTVTPDGEQVIGVITGCLTHSEGSALCSCLGTCTGSTGPDDVQPDGDCAGCPKGGVPLTAMLVGVVSTPECTAAMGEEAYDMEIAFTARRLPNVPERCAQ